MEALQYVWKGAIPLQIHLHDSEVTTLPPPPPLLLLAPRIGYLPLLISAIRPHFSSALPPGVDTVWFDYKGLPLKWYIPTGVLFDLLCAEPERPWNLTIHFRGYPENILMPCDGEDSIKWNFINSLKEAAYILNGNCKNVMNMSQPDQQELWRSFSNGDLEAFRQVSSKLKLETFEDEYTPKTNSISVRSQQRTSETDTSGQVKTVRIPVRLYVWNVVEDFEDLEDAPPVDNWDKISYINRPVEILKEEGKCFTLHEAIKCLLPELFPDKNTMTEEAPRVEPADDSAGPSVSSENACSGAEDKADKGPEIVKSGSLAKNADIKFIRIHGIEPKFEIPFSWVVNNLMNPEFFLHISVCVKVEPENTASSVA